MEEDMESESNNMPTDLGMGLPPTDNQAELTKFVLDPEARKMYKHITKDLAVSNLDGMEIAYIDINFRLLHMIEYVEAGEDDLADIKRVILQDVNSFLQILRSKGGFERLAEITKKMETKQKYEETRNKGNRWL